MIMTKPAGIVSAIPADRWSPANASRLPLPVVKTRGTLPFTRLHRLSATAFAGVLGCLLTGVPVLGASGLTGEYFAGYKVTGGRIVFDGLELVKTEINTSLDHWNGSQYFDWNPIGNRNYSVRWRGYLRAPETGQYRFGTISDDGSQVWIDGGLVVQNFEQQWYDWQGGGCWLVAGYHTIEITFYEAASFSGIEVWWLLPSAGSSPAPYSGQTFHTVPPTYNPNTLWKILSASVLFTEVPYVNPKIEVRLVDDTGELELTWLSYPDVSYTLESSSDLEVWQTAAGPWNGTGLEMTQLVDKTKEQEFFRVRVDEPAPPEP